MTDPRTPHPTRPPYFWLSVAGALIGLVLLGVRVATLPDGGLRSLLLGVAVAVAVTVGIAVAAMLHLRSRVDAAAAAYPSAMVIPIVVGTATAVATRWLAARVADPALALRPGTRAAVAIDAAGLHVVGNPRGRHGHLPSSAVTLGPLGRTVIGVREVDALVLEVEAGDVSAPLSLVPMRLRGNPFATLTDRELLDVSARIEAALAGRPVRPGWEF